MSTLRAEVSVAQEVGVVATQSRHLVIRASAGSGKTYQLVIRYLRTLLDGVPAERILASTFTRKAAGEILSRVLGRLAKASRDPADLKQLAGHLGDPGFNRTQCLALLKTLSAELHRMRVGTLDSFFARLATSYTLELGLPPGWDIIEELDDTALRSEAIATVLREGKSSDIQRLMNLTSKGDAPRSVSGKIRDTVKEFYEVFQQTDAAAWHAFPEVFPLTKEQIAVTIEALSQAEIPTLKSHLQTREKDCALALAEDWQQFLSRGFPANVRIGKRTFGSSKKELSQEACELYSRLIDHARAIIVLELAGRTAATHELLTRFDRAYQLLKQQSRRLRFEDVTQRLAGAFDDDQMQRLAYRLDSDVAHLLLDEFQDTSRLQWGVMCPFAEQISRAEEGTSFFCVGDVKQAIYGWRGGVAEIFDAVEDELPGIETAPLVESRRSSQAVIDVVNRLFTRLPRHENLKEDEQTVREWCSKFDPHRTARDISGYVTVETPDEADDPDAEKAADRVLAAAARRVAEIATEVPRASIGVLVRRKRSIPPLIHLLQTLQIDASEEGGNPLVDSAGVKLVLSLVWLADHPGDTVARFHVASSPLGAAVGYLDHTDDAAAEVLAAAIRRQLVDDGYGPTCERWVRALSRDCRRRDRGRLGQLVELAYRYDEQATLRPARFVEFVESEKVDAPSPAKVRVMTIHQAKGLEFDVVVLPLVESRLIARTATYAAAGDSLIDEPNRVSLYLSSELWDLLPEEFQRTFAAAKGAQVREELCALYVAVTRAVHALHILVPEPSATEKSLPKNTAGFVRAALLDETSPTSGNVLFEHGERDWAVRADMTASADQAEENGPVVEPAPVRVALGTIDEGRSRGLARVAPSQHDADQRLRLPQLVTSANAVALNRGTLFHAWFEEIEWLDDGSPGRKALTKIAERLGFGEGETQRHLAVFEEMLKRPTLVELLSLNSYDSGKQPVASWREAGKVGGVTFEVARERQVAVRLEGELLVGTIDRLVLLRQGGRVRGADIIDYKTDAVGEEGAEQLERTAHYRRQLTSYSAAIGRIYQLPPERIIARLAFVESGEIVIV